MNITYHVSGVSCYTYTMQTRAQYFGTFHSFTHEQVNISSLFEYVVILSDLQNVVIY